MISDELLDLGWNKSQDALMIEMNLSVGSGIKRVTGIHKTEIDVAQVRGKMREFQGSGK